jgi:hypothetical protein
MRLNQALQQADDQCLLLFGEVQKAWKSAASLQSDLTDHEAQITKLQVLIFNLTFLLLAVASCIRY